MFDVITSIMAHGAKALNIELPPEAEAAFEMYYDFLEKHGQLVNLTAISGAKDVARLHFLDSLALLNVTEFNHKSVIDIGSGAGFPGVPLLIAKPSINLTLLDATGKRINFLTALCELLGIKATFIKARAEEAAHMPDIRESYDIVLSRAVAPLNILCELCIPFVRIGGLSIAMKSVDSAEEVDEARSAINILGAELLSHADYTIPGTETTHRAIVIRKASNTKSELPRRYAKIKKSPL